jgi:hypothetical protein
MDLTAGTLHVLEGTRLTIEGPLTWQLATNANLINDGTIEFEPEAVLDEALGSAIVGAGVETTSRVFNASVIDNEPAGLGLAVSSGTALGAFTLIRGHVPFALMNGSVGIDRWYQLLTTDQPGGELETTIRYDPSELNSLEASSLDMYTAADPNDLWTPRSGEAFADPWVITATIYWPWNYISAFEADATTSITELPDPRYRARPTVTNDIVHLEALGNEGISSWELRDAAGRLHDGQRSGNSGILHHEIDMSRFANGIYLLRVNDEMVIKIMKQ